MSFFLILSDWMKTIKGWIKVLIQNYVENSRKYFTKFLTIVNYVVKSINFNDFSKQLLDIGLNFPNVTLQKFLIFFLKRIVSLSFRILHRNNKFHFEVLKSSKKINHVVILFQLFDQTFFVNLPFVFFSDRFHCQSWSLNYSEWQPFASERKLLSKMAEKSASFLSIFSDIGRLAKMTKAFFWHLKLICQNFHTC